MLVRMSVPDPDRAVRIPWGLWRTEERHFILLSKFANYQYFNKVPVIGHFITRVMY